MQRRLAGPSARPGAAASAVRFISASISASYHMLSAAAAPAPSAMHRIAVKPSTGWIGTGATSRPHSPVKTTSVITRGLVSARKSRQSAGRRRQECRRRHRHRQLTVQHPAPARRYRRLRAGWMPLRRQSTFGSVSNWWIGRRARQRPFERRRAFAPRIVRAFLPAISDQKMLMKKKTMPTAMIE